jgi:hypothetical protein
VPIGDAKNVTGSLENWKCWVAVLASFSLGFQGIVPSALADDAQRVIPAILMQVFHGQRCNFGAVKSYLQPYRQDGAVP